MNEAEQKIAAVMNGRKWFREVTKEILRDLGEAERVGFWREAKEQADLNVGGPTEITEPMSEAEAAVMDTEAIDFGKYSGLHWGYAPAWWLSLVEDCEPRYFHQNHYFGSPRRLHHGQHSRRFSRG